MNQHEHRRLTLREIYAAQLKAGIAARELETRSQIGQLQKDVRRHPLDPHLYESIATLHRDSGDCEAAEAALRAGIAACPCATNLYWRLATIPRGTRRTQEAGGLAFSAICEGSKGIPVLPL